MDRSLSLLLLLALMGVPFLSGCPSGGSGGDDDDAADDDDDGDDDDDDGVNDPCDSVPDITANINGDPVVGSTASASGDALTGSCGEGSPGAGEVIYAVTAPADGLMEASTDNALTDFDTILYVLTDCGDLGTEVACNDDVAQGVTTSTASWDATAGTTYYIVVDGFQSTGGFELSVEQAVCGDGAVAGDEQCDDNNTDSGDGCDASCNWECTDDANEDDDDIASATSLAGATFPATAAGQVLCPGDLNEEIGVYGDWWELTVAEGEYVSANVAGGASLTTTCADQTLSVALVDGDIQTLAGGDTSEGECASFDVEPAPGTYYLVVFGGDQTVAPQDYEVTVDVGVSVCGDGVQTGVEECDDNNTDPGDGCSPTCVAEDATCNVVSAAEASIGGAALTGDTSVGTDDHEPQACSLGGGAPEDVYSLTVTEDTTIIVSLENENTDFDTTLYVRSSCTDPGSEIACNDDSPNGGLESALFFEALKDETYYIFVDGYDTASGAYGLELSSPVCGDGNVDLNEDCDDQNQTPGDGCENDCTITPICAYTADQALGTLAAGETNVTVTLAAGADTLPDLACSQAGGGDQLISFSLATGGDVEFTLTQTGDAQIGIFSNDGDCTAGACEDPVGAEEYAFTWTGATAGDYYMLIEAWGDGDEGDVSLTITAP